MNKRKLSISKVAVSLISVHYGLGFLLGTSEAVFNTGLAGILYSLSCGLGLIFLIFLVPFYWKNKVPIWDLLGSKYGSEVKNNISILSCLWMIGVVASQVLGAAFILKTLGVPSLLGMLIFIASIMFVSQLQIKKLSSVFLVLLILSSISLFTAIIKLNGFKLIKDIVAQTPIAVSKQNYFLTLGIALPTILITVLGMDFHQFIVQGKNIKTSVLGTFFAGVLLILISFIPVLVVQSAISKQIITSGINGKQVIPFVLLYVGKSFGSNILSYLLVIALLTVAVGSGSGVTRIIFNTVNNFSFLPKSLRKKSIILLTISVIVLFLALIGKTIVSLIVSFYVVYICGVLIPFLVYLLQKKIRINIDPRSVQLSTITGSVSSLAFFIISKLNLLPTGLADNVEFNMILVGLYFSFSTVVVITFAKNYLNKSGLNKLFITHKDFTKQK